MGCAHHPANPLPGFPSVTHVYEAAAGESVDGVLGYEFRVVDVTGDEVSDNCWHPVYQGKVINTALDFGGNDSRTLGIEKDDVLIEV